MRGFGVDVTIDKLRKVVVLGVVVVVGFGVVVVVVGFGVVVVVVVVVGF